MNLNLSNIEQRQLHTAMCNVATALSDLSPVMRELVLPVLSARSYDIVVSYIGTIRNAVDQIDQLLYREDVREPDACDPHGIVVTDEVATARLTWWQHNGKTNRLEEQLSHGLITRDEFIAAMAALNASIEGGAAAVTPAGTPG